MIVDQNISGYKERLTFTDISNSACGHFESSQPSQYSLVEYELSWTLPGLLLNTSFKPPKTVKQHFDHNFQISNWLLTKLEISGYFPKWIPNGDNQAFLLNPIVWHFGQKWRIPEKNHHCFQKNLNLLHCSKIGREVVFSWQLHNQFLISVYDRCHRHRAKTTGPKNERAQLHNQFRSDN